MSICARRSTEQSDALLAEIRRIAGQPDNPAVSVTLRGGWTRPVFPRSTGTQALFSAARAIAAELDIPAFEVHSSGGSDGSLAAALGVPTLDGLGPVWSRHLQPRRDHRDRQHRRARRFVRRADRRARRCVMSLMTGTAYKASLRDGRQVWIDGERVDDVTRHAAFRGMIDTVAQIYDLQHDPRHADLMTFDLGDGQRVLFAATQPGRAGAAPPHDAGGARHGQPGDRPVRRRDGHAPVRDERSARAARSLRCALRRQCRALADAIGRRPTCS